MARYQVAGRFFWLNEWPKTPKSIVENNAFPLQDTYLAGLLESDN
jgi:hypothetical protein